MPSQDTASPSEVTACLSQEAKAIERMLAGCLEGLPMPDGLRASMEYSLLAGGKRVRPILFLLFSRLFGLDTRQVMPFAAGIECIHTYSLIHDDLPAMDDDDLRRGKPSNHKQFDEATAILAGDALLTDAFALMTLVEGIPAGRIVEAVRAMSTAAGSAGMVGGQFLDIRYTEDHAGVSIQELAMMHAMKTGALLQAACVSGALLGGASEEEVIAVQTYGLQLGAAFQITDDILDATGDEKKLGKPVGSDASKDKITYVSLLGLEASRALAEEKTSSAIQALQGFTGIEACLLRGVAKYMTKRTE